MGDKRKLNVGIIDYGMGNIRSVENALIRLGCTVNVSQKEDLFQSVDAIILPGVGAFGEAMENLSSLKLIEPLKQAVIDKGIPLLGICLGMQLLAESSEEHGQNNGLGFIKGKVRKIPAAGGLRLPHVGWNTINANKIEPLFVSAHKTTAYYFVHSYYFDCDQKYISAYTDYGSDVVAAVQNENVFGVQFHPERSQRAGLLLLRDFIEYIEKSLLTRETA